MARLEEALDRLLSEAVALPAEDVSIGDAAGRVGYRAKDYVLPLEMSRVDAYDWEDYWDPVYRETGEDRIVLAPGLDILPDSPQRRDESHAEHVAIVRALETGSASSTREAMQHHVLESERMIRRAMLDVSAQSDTGAGSAQDADTAPGTAAPGVVIGAAIAESST